MAKYLDQFFLKSLCLITTYQPKRYFPEKGYACELCRKTGSNVFDAAPAAVIEKC